MPAEEIGSLAQAILTAYNKLVQLRASGASDVAIRIQENVLEAAKLAQRAATGSQQGMANFFGQSASAVRQGAGSVSNEAGAEADRVRQVLGQMFASGGLGGGGTVGTVAGGAGLIGAGGLLLGGSTPSQQQAQQMIANPSPTWGDIGQALQNWLGLGGGGAGVPTSPTGYSFPYGPGGAPVFNSPPGMNVSGISGGRVTPPQPVTPGGPRFLPGEPMPGIPPTPGGRPAFPTTPQHLKPTRPTVVQTLRRVPKPSVQGQRSSIR